MGLSDGKRVDQKTVDSSKNAEQMAEGDRDASNTQDRPNEPQSASDSLGVEAKVRGGAGQSKASPGASSSDDSSTNSTCNSNSTRDQEAKKQSHTTTKKVKTSLRKGKWAVEEEEYTSRMIQHFSAGLLTLPDGATLRSHLADTLNCDPMRITKKFTGACCLGRRAYHLRDGPRATPTELKIARVERDHLEQRFRMRIEHDQSGLPLPRRQEMILSQPQPGISPLYPRQNLSAGNTLSPWLQTLNGTTLPNNAALSLSGNQGLLAGAIPPLPIGALRQNQAQWLVPVAPGSATVDGTNGQADRSLQLLNNLVTSWAIGQAAASLSPASLAVLSGGSSRMGQGSNSIMHQHQPLSQASLPVPLPAAASSPSNEEHQRQLKSAFEEHKKEEEQRQLRAAFEDVKRKEAAGLEIRKTGREVCQANTVSSSSTASKEASPAEQLQRSYQAHLQALQQKEEREDAAPKEAKAQPTLIPGDESVDGSNREHFSEMTADERPMDDEEAGTVLLGFLNSLRQSYEDAVDEKTTGSKVQSPHNNLPTYRSLTSESNRESSLPAKALKSQSSGKLPRPSKSHSKRARKGDSHSEMPRKERKQVSKTPAFTDTCSQRTRRPASVTDISSGNSSSQPTESSSSLEDSSDKTDPSSSEESEKEPPTPKRRSSKGPPRKRLKAFTEANVMEHSKRMSGELDD